MKDILFRAKVAPLEKKIDCCRSCRGTRCEICKHVVTIKTSRSFSTKREYCIKPNNLNCRSGNVVYLFHAKHVQNNTQIVSKVFDLDSTITSQPIGISLKGIPPNKCHFTLILKMTNIMVWVSGKSLIDQTYTVDDLRKRESFWQYELDTFQPNGFNERDVTLFWHFYLLNL